MPIIPQYLSPLEHRPPLKDYSTTTPQILKSRPLGLQSPSNHRQPNQPQTLTALTASLSAGSDVAISAGRLALSSLLRPSASGFVRSSMESEADMAATPGTASEGPGASMAEPCGDCLWARPSWHGPRRTAEARAPLGLLCRQGWRLVGPGSRSCDVSQAGSAQRSCCAGHAPQNRSPEGAGRPRLGGSVPTRNCFSNCGCRGNPGGRMMNPERERNQKSWSRLVTLTYREKTFIAKT